MFRASSCPLSGAYQLQQQPQVYRRNVVVAVLLVVVGPVWLNLLFDDFFLENISKQFKFDYNLKRITGTLHEDWHTFMIIFLFDAHYNPLWVLAFAVILYHSALSLHCFFHCLIPIICISSSISAIHLFLGLPLILVPIGIHSNINIYDISLNSF
jgi:hypothetical protein